MLSLLVLCNTVAATAALVHAPAPTAAHTPSANTTTSDVSDALAIDIAPTVYHGDWDNKVA